MNRFGFLSGCSAAFLLLGISNAASQSWRDLDPTNPRGTVGRSEVGRGVRGARDVVNEGVKTVGQLVAEAAPVVAAIKCPMCVIIASRMSAQDQKVINAINSVGLVITVLGPVAGPYSIYLIGKDNKPREVRLNPRSSPSTGTTRSLSASCILQTSGRIEAYFVEKPSEWDSIKPGDRIIAETRVACEGYESVSQVQSITRGIFLAEAKNTDDFAGSGELKYTVSGPATQ